MILFTFIQKPQYFNTARLQSISSKIKMDQQESPPFKEEIIEIVAEDNTQKDQSEVEEQSSFQDQLIPRPAFQIDLNNQHLTEEERDAMQYILAVRNQKQSLTVGKKTKVYQREGKIIIQSNLQTNLQKLPKNDYATEIKLIQNQINEWKNEHISNWRCVVSNMQFIHKVKKPHELFRQKLTQQVLYLLPEVDKIAKNKWLTLPQIEELLIDLSNYYCEILSQSQNTKNKKNQYHIWIYSLLALHQSYASYTNFEALASINACMELEYKKHLKNIQSKTYENQQSLHHSITQWLTTLTVLKQVFKQHFLAKYLNLLKEAQMI